MTTILDSKQLKRRSRRETKWSKNSQNLQEPHLMTHLVWRRWGFVEASDLWPRPAAESLPGSRRLPAPRRLHFLETPARRWLGGTFKLNPQWEMS